MPKKQYKCEVCGKRDYIGNVVCCICVERDLIKINDRIKVLEKKFAISEKDTKDKEQSK